MKKFLCSLVAGVLIFGSWSGWSSDGLDVAWATSVGDVVINEVAWAGTVDNSNDEWIELYNASSSAVDLSGWFVEDDYASQYLIEGGVIPAHGYFLIEDSESAVSNVLADALVGLSLANSGDTLVLKDSAGSVVDTVNSGGGAWYAGDGTSKASMERIDPTAVVDSSDNFASATLGNGSVGSNGSAILGTPGSQNSVYQGSSSSPTVAFDLSDENPLPGEVLTATVIVSNVSDLFAYGFDIVYDPLVFEYVSSSEEVFLNSGGSISTAFNSALENGQAGTVIIGNARLGASSGASGSGNLFTLTFNVVGSEGDVADLVFGGGSFLADTSSDILVNFSSSSLSVSSNSVGGVSGFAVTEGVNAYALDLSWEAPLEGADSYIVERQKADGSFVQIGTSTEITFMDNDDLNFGGGIVPGVSYVYRVRAVKNGIQSAAAEINGLESRGLVGDNNRSGRVDGRDIEALARLYGTGIDDGDFDTLVDTTFDGLIDGSDLIDIGANFGLTYSM
ncbi:hypothetical protein HOF67_02380 [Candidatus Peregrinibacteria bacterium]|jgi:hypothetical protein|nr:hypothetical protein [Candidatus Peregrinibacteria bacterium]